MPAEIETVFEVTSMSDYSKSVLDREPIDDQNDEYQDVESAPIEGLGKLDARGTYCNDAAFESDDEDDWDSDEYENCQTPWATELGYNAKKSVKDWVIRGVGKRPHDFIARDVLFGSLFRDHRVPWFHRYVRCPSQWMQEIVRDLPDECRLPALEYLALHYQHKLHLARMVEMADKEFGEDSKEMKTIGRLWKCTPSTVMVARSKPRSWCIPMQSCGLYHLCPWCFARKVTVLYDCIRTNVLADVAGKHLLLAKMTYAEPLFGRGEEYRVEDVCSMKASGWVRDYYGRYYGRDKTRAIESRNYVITRMADALPKLTGGVMAYQLGSSELNGRRSFLHDVGAVGVIGDATQSYFQGSLDSGDPVRMARKIEDDLVLNLLVVPADHTSALRTMLTGTSFGFKGKTFGMEEGALPKGISGALSWQPAFLLDDHVWFSYLEAVKHQRLYRPFGDWLGKLPQAMVASRQTVDQKFRRAQQDRLEQQKQQKGNRRRHGMANLRRQELLKVAEPLWPRVVTAAQGSRGRPAYRSRLEEEMKVQGMELSRRDLEWLVKSLRGRDEMAMDGKDKMSSGPFMTQASISPPITSIDDVTDESSASCVATTGQEERIVKIGISEV
jgi:hypothetical protein